jgi:hypothetical protein
MQGSEEEARQMKKKGRAGPGPSAAVEVAVETAPDPEAVKSYRWNVEVEFEGKVPNKDLVVYGKTAVIARGVVLDYLKKEKLEFSGMMIKEAGHVRMDGRIVFPPEEHSEVIGDVWARKQGK